MAGIKTQNRSQCDTFFYGLFFAFILTHRGKLMKTAIFLIIFGATVTASATHSAIQRICSQYSYVNEQEACYLRIGHLQPADGVVRICSQYSYVNEQENCHLNIGPKGSIYSPLAARICRQYSYVNEQEACAKRLIGKQFNENDAAARVCLQYSYVNEQVDCLERIGNTLPDEDDTNSPHKLTIDLLKDALRAIDSGNTQSAKESVRSAIRRLRTN